MKEFFKRIGLVSTISMLIANTASAGAVWVPVTEPESGDGTAGLILLLLIGAVIVMNGAGSGRAKDTQTEQDDDDVLMRF